MFLKKVTQNNFTDDGKDLSCQDPSHRHNISQMSRGRSLRVSNVKKDKNNEMEISVLKTEAVGGMESE